MAKVTFKIEGMKELQRNLKKLGEVPQKHVTASSRKGMSIVLKQARANAPYDTGALKRGIKLVGEKAKVKGKKVYRIVFDRAMNEIFQKKNKEGKVVAYYPVSQEYGYFTRNGRYIPGFRFIRGAFEENTQKMANTIVDTMKKKIDDEIRKAGVAMIEAALREALENTISEFAGEIYPTNAPENATKPYLVYMRITTTKLKTLNGLTGKEYLSFMFNIMAQKYSEMKSLTERVEGFLISLPGTQIGSYCIEDIDINNVHEQYEHELKINRGIIDFTIYFEEVG